MLEQWAAMQVFFMWAGVLLGGSFALLLIVLGVWSAVSKRRKRVR